MIATSEQAARPSRNGNGVRPNRRESRTGLGAGLGGMGAMPAA
jgi:hypothetical protein